MDKQFQDIRYGLAMFVKVVKWAFALTWAIQLLTIAVLTLK